MELFFEDSFGSTEDMDSKEGFFMAASSSADFFLGLALAGEPGDLTSCLRVTAGDLDEEGVSLRDEAFDLDDLDGLGELEGLIELIRSLAIRRANMLCLCIFIKTSRPAAASSGCCGSTLAAAVRFREETDESDLRAVRTVLRFELRVVDVDVVGACEEDPLR